MLQSVNMSLTAVKSMQAIDDWMDTVNANLNGIAKTAFKESNISFGGNITYTLRTPRQDQAGEMIAEQALTVGSTNVSWRQGTIVSSTEDTHFAIQGEGFFLAADYPTRSDYVGHTTPNLDDLYVTRDGTFHWSIIPAISATDPVLVTENGMLVMGEGNGLTTSNNHLIRIMYSEFTNGTHKPSVVLPDYSGPSGAAGTQTIDLQQLQYSKFGSTYFSAPTAGSFKTIVNGNDGVFDRRDINGVPGNSVLLQNSLEASNTSTERNITHLSMLGKIYNGFVQVIKVYNSNTDEVLGFIK